jgi:hypothetical protein
MFRCGIPTKLTNYQTKAEDINDIFSGSVSAFGRLPTPDCGFDKLSLNRQAQPKSESSATRRGHRVFFSNLFPGFDRLSHRVKGFPSHPLAQKKQLFTCTCHWLTDFFAGYEIAFFVFGCCPAAVHTGICTIHLVQCFGRSLQCRQTGWHFFPQPRYRLGGGSVAVFVTQG